MKETFVSIVGRPNVGKSTLFNKFLGKRKSIVDSQEGITRDRIYGETIWTGHTLNFIDTGGYIPEDLDIFNSAVRDQALAAVLESDLILFISTDEKDERPLAKSIPFSFTIKIFSPFLKSPITLVIPAGNKLLPFDNAFAAPVSTKIFADELKELTIHFFLASSVDIFGIKEVYILSFIIFLNGFKF